jgi:hypothetical protein
MNTAARPNLKVIVLSSVGNVITFPSVVRFMNRSVPNSSILLWSILIGTFKQDLGSVFALRHATPLGHVIASQLA